MSANDRIQWLHKKISENCYPSIAHLTEKFSISRRQAQRDIDHLKNVLKAPLLYSHTHRGYYYSSKYSLPFITEKENDTDFHDVIASLREFGNSQAESSALQLQLPYTALLEIKDIMTVLNLRNIIVAEEQHHRYRCEFQSIELFLGMIISMGADIRIIEPLWLRNRLVDFAKKILTNNADQE